jgi:energy-coupling factor transporter ATP-binding protein EcfA2
MPKIMKGVPSDILRKIWTVLGEDGWLSLLSTYRSDLEFNHKSHNVLSGKCLHPDHHDKHPSAFFRLDRGYYVCYGCTYYERNPVILLQYILQCSKAEALQFLTAQYNIKFLSKKAQAELENQQFNQHIKQEIFRVSHDFMCSYIADPTNPAFDYCKDSVDYLVNYRKLDIDTFHALPIGILPDTTTIAEHSLKNYQKDTNAWENNDNKNALNKPVNVSGAVYDYLNKAVTPDFVGSLVFPLHINPKEIGRIKLRVPNASRKEIKIIDDDYDDYLGLYGLGWGPYKEFFDQTNRANYIYITEGEFDAMNLMSQWIKTGSVPFPLIAAGGSGSNAQIEPILHAVGYDAVYLIGDAPHNKGNQIVSNWLQNIKKLHTRVFIGWDKMPNAEDLDTAVNIYGVNTVEEHLKKEGNNSFVAVWSWCVDIVKDTLDGLPADDFRAIMEKAAHIGRLIRNKLEQQAYCDAISDLYNIKSSLLKRQITAYEDSELGFLQRCIDALSDLVYVVGNELSADKRVIVLFIKKTKELHKVKLDSDHFAEELASVIGTMYDFVVNHVGLPSFIQNPEDDPDVRILLQVDREVKFFVKQALISMSQGSPTINDRKLRQGYQCRKDFQGVKHEYLVCGSALYYITRGDGGVCNYTELEGPSHNNFVFDIHHRHGQTVDPWYPGGISLKLLEERKKSDLKHLYNTLVEMFDCAFTFKHQKVTCQALAALMCVLPVSTAFSRQLLIFITGDTGSGKSTLLSMFSNIQNKETRLLFSSSGFDSAYTHAGVCAEADGSSLLLVLDEFEAKDNHSKEHVPKIFETFRGLVAGDATRRMGQSGNSKGVTQYFNLPVIFAGIQGAERPADVNRLLIVEMKKIETKDFPSEVIARKYDQNTINDIREILAAGVYPYAQQLAQNERNMRHKYEELRKLVPFNVSARLSSSLFILMSFLELIGEDYMEFYKEYIIQNAEIVKVASSINESDSYLNALLRNPITLLEDGNASRTTIMKLLIDSEYRHTINSAAWGAYYDIETDRLLLLLDTVMHTLVPNHLKVRGMMGSRLKEILSRHKQALAPAEIVRSGILTKAAAVLGAGLRERDVVVFDVVPWVRQEVKYVEPKEGAKEEPLPIEDEAYNDW